MKIDFTKEQFESLLKVVYLGIWMVKSSEEEPAATEFDPIEEYVLSFAKAFGLDQYVEYDEEEGRYHPSKGLEENEEIDGHIQRYDDCTFWEKLIFNLARRDMERKYGERAIARMTQEEHLIKEQPFIEKYEREFEENGLRNLLIKSQK